MAHSRAIAERRGKKSFLMKQSKMDPSRKQQGVYQGSCIVKLHLMNTYIVVHALPSVTCWQSDPRSGYFGGNLFAEDIKENPYLVWDYFRVCLLCPSFLL